MLIQLGDTILPHCLNCRFHIVASDQHFRIAITFRPSMLHNKFFLLENEERASLYDYKSAISTFISKTSAVFGK